MKSLFYPAHHFSEPLLSDMQGGKGGIYEHMEESGGGVCGVGNTKNSDRVVRKTMRARETASRDERPGNVRENNLKRMNK